MYETFEHTADIGLRVTAPDLEHLFAEAGRGLFSIIIDNLDEVRPQEAVTLAIDDGEQGNDYLLFDWLNELLYRFDTEHWIFTQFEIKVSEQGLVAEARGEKLDPARHRTMLEVKAITYHLLSVEQTESGWQAEVIVDI